MINLLTFVYFAELSIITGASPVKVFGLGRFFNEIGFLIGVLLSILASRLITENIVSFESVLLFISAFLICLVMFALFKQDRLAFSINEASEAKATSESLPTADAMLEMASQRLSETYRLTNREGEVLSYLVKGHSLPYIRNELHIAQSTIDTHVRHIYEKLGIHSREELLSIVHKKEN